MNGTATIEAEVVSVEEGTQAQYASLGSRIRDRVVLVNSRCPAYSHRPRTCRREKYLQAVEGGAAGFIYMRHEGGLLPEVYSLSSDGPAPVPGVSVTREAGSALLRYVRRGAAVRLDLENQITPGCRGTLLPTCRGHDAPVILVGAPTDTLVVSWSDRRCLGVAVLLKAARVLRPSRRPAQDDPFRRPRLDWKAVCRAPAYIGAHRGT
jgi:hypothetical protein